MFSGKRVLSLFVAVLALSPTGSTFGAEARGVPRVPFVYSQHPTNRVFAPPDERRIGEIAAHLPEKPGWYQYFDCGDKALEQALTRKMPDVSDEAYLRHFKDGNRTEYQREADDLHGMLGRLSAAVAKMKPDDPRRSKALARLAEVIEVCIGMKSWVQPAHDPNRGDVWRGRLNRIDLASSWFSATLSFALLKCGDELPAGLAERLRAELRRRTFDSYLHSAAMTTNPRDDPREKNHWFYLRDNWNAVCHCFCVEAALAAIEDRHERARFIEAAERALPYYLSGFYDDGYCFEGCGYWDYGFGNFLRLTDIVRKATDGFVDFSKLPRAKEMMAYGYTAKMDATGVRPRFADASGGSPGSHWLDLGVKFWPEMKALRDGEPPIRTFFPEAQVYIGRADGLSFAIKGGQNDLPHCHRDLGSWDLVTNGVYVAGDPGGEIYTARTFSAQRFESRILNSYGHPVPRVNGELQGGGARALAWVEKTDFTEARDVLVLDLTDGYPCLRGGKGRLLRTVTFDRANRRVEIRDDFTAQEPMAFDSPVVFAGAENPFVPTVIGGDWRLVGDDVENPGRATQHRQSVTFDDKVTSATVIWAFSCPDVRRPCAETDPMRLARKVADSYLARNSYETNEWALWWDWATLWWGVTKLGLADRSTPYVDYMLKLGEHFKWGWKESEPIGYHADSQCIGQAYLDLALAGVTDKGAQVVRKLEDHIAFEAPATDLSFEWPKKGEWATGLRRWKWCDTLFMAPTVFVRMTKWTGERKYLEFADSEFRALSDYLFSEEHGFYFRDQRFFVKKSPNGKPEFWSRGNGWVFAALAQMLEFMPKDWPTRDWYARRFRRMAESVKAAQTPDGTWHVNLLDPAEGGNEPEMSGTCLYLYGYLWGLNNGFFEARDYGATVERAWKAVLAEVKADGRIGRMQRPASAPGKAGSDEEAPYGVGAFLSACVEMSRYRGK